MFCIRCQSEMKKTIFESVVVDYCNNCKSFWLDGGEFEHSLKEIKFDVEKCHEIAELENNNNSIHSFHNNLCPKCKNAKMFKVNKFGICLDQCEKCNGIFFDNHELQQCFEKANESFFVRLWHDIKENFK